VNAATVTRAGMLQEAHAALHMAMEVPEPRPLKLAAALAVLGDALDIYAELAGADLHWENVYPHLADEADPDGEALRKAAEEAEAAAEDLIKAMAAHCGTEDEMTKNAAGDMR